jgi:hypothetical protein
MRRRSARIGYATFAEATISPTRKPAATAKGYSVRRFMKNEFLKVGDVFKIKPGMEVYAEFPAYYIFDNVRSNSKDATELHSHDVTVGEKLKNRYETGHLAGDYVVTRTADEDGGTGMGPHDVYPDGWHVTAKKLKNGRWDENGIEISFYQSGCFTAMNEKVPVIRTMKMRFE